MFVYRMSIYSVLMRLPYILVDQSEATPQLPKKSHLELRSTVQPDLHLLSNPIELAHITPWLALQLPSQPFAAQMALRITNVLPLATALPRP